MGRNYTFPMVSIRLVTWEEARSEASRIRFAVFVDEQQVPAEIELDEHDPHCIHALAADSSGKVVGTGRLLPDGHIGRMAVSREARGQGVGGAILEALAARACERGDREVVLNAQVQAMGFYRAHGFVEEGPEFDDAGIPHRAMRRRC